MSFDPAPLPAPPSTRPHATPGNGLLRALAWLLPLVVVPLAFVFMLMALLAGVVLALGMVAWALLRGRRPAPGLFSAHYHRARERNRPGSGSGRAGGDGFVVDVDAVEVAAEQTKTPQR